MADYLFREPPGIRNVRPRLYLLLHGFGQSAREIWEQLEPELSEEGIVLSPNGPFPIPRRAPPSDKAGSGLSREFTGGEWTVGFAWYFYRPETDEYFIDMEIGVRYLVGLIEKLGLSSVPTTVIGFSQGGYLAPFLAQVHPSIDRVIGIGSQFLVEEIGLPVRFRMDAVHGARDDRVNPEISRRYHDRLREAGAKGDFVLVPEAGHRIDRAIVAELRRLLGPG